MSQLSEALRGGRQCDTDGTSVIVSRQACVQSADKIEELEQRIADNEKRYNILDRMHKEASRKLVEERDGLKEQLIAYEAASVVKDMALERIASINLAEYLLPEDFAFRVLQVRKALAIQPDDSALKAWLGEPVAFFYEQAATKETVLSRILDDECAEREPKTRKVKMECFLIDGELHWRDENLSVLRHWVRQPHRDIVVEVPK